MSAWRYTSAPERELRMYPRDAWRGWRPIGSPLPHGFDDDGEAEAIVARVRREGCVAAYELTLSHSADGNFIPVSARELLDRQRPRLRLRKPEMLQQRWEREQSEARLAKEAEADRLWQEAEQEETERRRKIEAAQRKAAETRAAKKVALDAAKALHRQQAGLDRQAYVQIELARIEWSRIDWAFAEAQYRKVLIPHDVFIYGWWLTAGREYWLPDSVIEQLPDEMAV